MAVLIAGFGMIIGCTAIVMFMWFGDDEDAAKSSQTVSE